MKRRRLVVAALALAAAAAYAAVHAGASSAAGAWTAVKALGQAPKLQSGTAGPIVVSKPSGQAAFTVAFPQPFNAPPRVVLTVSGDADNLASARLSGPETTTGFQAIVAVPFFVHRTSSTVTINWIALGE